MAPGAAKEIDKLLPLQPGYDIKGYWCDSNLLEFNS